MARPRTRFLDLEREDVFDGECHSDHVNVAIHALAVLLTAAVLLHFTGRFPHADGACAALYGAYHLLLDRRSSALAALLCFLCWASSDALAARLGFSTGRKVVLVVQLFCWTMQFTGHKSFEKRVPPAVGNLVQAFVTGPFFVLQEVLHSEHH